MQIPQIGMPIGILLVAAGLFALGAAAILLTRVLPGRAVLAAELWAIYRNEALIVAVLLVPVVIGGWLFLLAMLMFLWRGEAEMFDLFDTPAFGPIQGFALGGGFALAMLGLAGDLLLMRFAFAIAVGAILLASLGYAFRWRAQRWRTTFAALTGLIFPAFAIALIAALRGGANGLGWTVLVYATIEMNDAFALLGGKLFGRWRILPRLSSDKTGEGLIIGLVAGGITGSLAARQLLGLGLDASLRVVLLTLVAGITGDLAVSALKRWRGRKDFAAVLTPQGGVLDIYDSFLVAAPVVFFLRGLLV